MFWAVDSERPQLCQTLADANIVMVEVHQPTDLSVAAHSDKSVISPVSQMHYPQ